MDMNVKVRVRRSGIFWVAQAEVWHVSSSGGYYFNTSVHRPTKAWACGAMKNCWARCEKRRLRRNSGWEDC